MAHFAPEEPFCSKGKFTTTRHPSGSIWLVDFTGMLESGSHWNVCKLQILLPGCMNAVTVFVGGCWFTLV